MPIMKMKILNAALRGIIADLRHLSREALAEWESNPDAMTSLNVLVFAGFATFSDLDRKSALREEANAFKHGDGPALTTATRSLSGQRLADAMAEIGPVLAEFVEDAADLEDSYFSAEIMLAAERTEKATDLLHLLLSCELAVRHARIRPQARERATRAAIDLAEVAVERARARVLKAPTSFLAAALWAVAMERFLGDAAPDWLHAMVQATATMENMLEFRGQDPIPGIKLP